MSRFRAALGALALLLSSAAFGFIWNDIPPSKLTERLHGPRALAQTARPAVQLGGRPSAHGRVAVRTTLSGPIAALYAVDLDGQETEVLVQPGLDLDDPLPVSEDAVELVIVLDGPVLVTRALKDGGRILSWVDLPELRVVLEDPDDASARGTVSLMVVGETGAGLLEDAVVGVGW